MTPSESHEGVLSVRDQIERYRSAFIAVVTMVVIAAVVGGYILAHENLKLPSWVPVLGHTYFKLEAEFQTAQAVTPGQGQAVTIAGAKIGEIATVDLHDGVAIVTMNVNPKYAKYIYRNATMLLRPKTQLQDITVEVSPGTPSAGKLRSGEVLPLSQTAANIDFDEFLAGLDAETRAYLQELLAGLGEGLKGNGRALSATLKRFDPTARLTEEIAQQLEIRHANVARSIHNFRLLTEALGDKDQQLSQLVDASNAVFATFAKEDASFEKTLRAAARRAAQDRRGPGQARNGDPRARARRCTSSCRSRAPSARPTKPRESWRRRPRRSSRTRSARSRAKSCPSSTNWGRPRRSSAKPCRSSRRASRCSTNSSTRSPTTPDRARAASCSSSTGATTTSTASSAPPTPTAPSAAAWSTSTAKSCRSSKGPRKSTRR